MGARVCLSIRDLLADGARNAALQVNAAGILFDYSRQNATVEVGRRGRPPTRQA